MIYRIIVKIEGNEDTLIGDKERIAQAIESVAGVKSVSFPHIEYEQEVIK